MDFKQEILKLDEEITHANGQYLALMQKAIEFKRDVIDSLDKKRLQLMEEAGFDGEFGE